MNSEKKRLTDNGPGNKSWRRWGPYLSDRQWGTVREDYSPGGKAWEYFTFEDSFSRAYRWGEDGIGGISDENQLLCFAPAMWNGRDPVLKERLFGLTGPEGNHGEDVKEYYYYLDNTPTHSYMKMLYKYPQKAFPYGDLLAAARRRGLSDDEFELIDSGILDDDRYFDIFVEYAKAGPDDIAIRISACNRGPEAAKLHLMPQLWCRNTWSWEPDQPRPEITLSKKNTLKADFAETGQAYLYFPDNPETLFCDNETNSPLLFNDKAQPGRFYKDGINRYIVSGDKLAVNPKRRGTRMALHYQFDVPAGETVSVLLRLSEKPQKQPLKDLDKLFEKRIAEADAFYEELQKPITNSDARLVQRQALAGMLWTKQFYCYDLQTWLKGDPEMPPPPPERQRGRNFGWTNIRNADVLSMPDKWEYPWYAAWDLAFHCIPLAMVDADFAKNQLLLLTRERYMHPNGQLPAYEWNFSDVNPPVHAWAAWRVYKIDQKQRRDGKKGAEDDYGDLLFLERIFHKMLLNFTWWVNRKDEDERNIFQGGFLGLDNIGIFDRSHDLPAGGHLEQADGTSWMAMYCLNMMRMALELSASRPAYQDLASKFFEHFLSIAAAMINLGGEGVSLWDEEDEFYYDYLHAREGHHIALKVRSMVGLIPLFAVEILEPAALEKVPVFKRRVEYLLKNRPELAGLISRWHEPGMGDRRLLSLLRGHRMKCLLRRMLDEGEFLSDFGVRALSKYHKKHPFTLAIDGQDYRIGYVPGVSDTHMFGGNSNWRGPIWFPVNFLLIESLQRFHHYYGDDFKIEYPHRSGNYMTILDVADRLSERLSAIFLKDKDGRRPVFGAVEKFQSDPHFKDYILFYEYFHGDSGTGLGASHQTGWTGLIAKLLQPRPGGN